ncbi:hypothetical protein BDD43_2270 [Mucilaginibacter gracilis]|uniref:Uncharacterized protein n=1 Tax=Mucilaginibacter gracilis TaxID=423350 RepID=A0A495J009_9SPHI|nr:hypothetical protein [Mucilaginibacter gracilis]RKR82103.1 hypothetical protein BDD43_2270 [Mucilaginibacter gracilis]
MSERSDEKQTYPFHWLDQVVEVTLNPAKTSVKHLPAETMRAISDRLPDEFAEVTSRLKAQAFCLYTGEHIKVVAGHYDQAVRLLQKQAADNLSQYPRTGLLRQTGEMILERLNDLALCLYTRYPAYLPPALPAEPEEIPAGLLSKILCALSADQLGILLRAATDAGVLVGRSFRKVCKAVAPYLSTPWKTDIRPDTLRSHGTRPESRDKEVTIAFLEKMIEKIRGYR